MEGSLPRDPFAPGDEAAEGDAGSPKGIIPETVKKALLAGVGALFMTEESARRLAREWKLPKDVVGFVGQQAAAAKDEVLRLLGQEIRRFLESEAMRREFLRALSDSTVEIHAEIRVRPGEDGKPRPVVKATTRGKRAPRAGAGHRRPTEKPGAGGPGSPPPAARGKK
jgi:hypothetical protein